MKTRTENLILFLIIFIIGAFFLFSYNSLDVEVFDVNIIGHRGSGLLAPENTITSFQKGADIGLRYMEFDIIKSRDNELIAFHDKTLDRTTDASGEVRYYSLEELKRLDADNDFPSDVPGKQEIPTLEEALDFFRESNIVPFLEIKEPGISRDVVRAVKENDMEDDVVIISFIQEEVENVDSDIMKGLLVRNKCKNSFWDYICPPNWRDGIERAQEINADLLIVRFDHVGDKNSFIEKTISAGIEPVFYKVDREKDIEYLFSGKIKNMPYGIVTDIPIKSLELKESYSKPE